MTTGSTHDVLGTTVAMPVEIRDARCFAAAFTADAAALQRAMNDPEHPDVLRPLQIRPGRGLCMLVFVDYVDGDLGPYNEFGVCLLVDDPAHRSSPLGALASLARGDAHAMVQRLPVDGEFTCAAGRGIWGFPKFMAQFEADHDGPHKHARVSEDGELIADLRLGRGVAVPVPSAGTELTAYARMDGTLRSIPWRLGSLTGVRARPAGATLRLGDHPIAGELRSLRLSRHALMTMSVAHLEMTFADATVVPD
ncbi:acetoacetate decarboxylase family protein [Gordonia sp. NPDC003429]